MAILEKMRIYEKVIIGFLAMTIYLYKVIKNKRKLTRMA